MGNVITFPIRPADAHINDGYAYIVEYENGTIKVGKTRNPQKRLRTHKSTGRKLGIEVSRWHVSEIHRTYSETEKHLITFCRNETGGKEKGEYFKAPLFDGCVEYLNTLNISPSTDEEIAQDKRKADEATKMFKDAANAVVESLEKNKNLYSVTVDSEYLAVLAALGLDPNYKITSSPDKPLPLDTNGANKVLEILDENYGIPFEDAIHLTFFEFIEISFDMLKKVMVLSAKNKILKQRPELMTQPYFDSEE